MSSEIIQLETSFTYTVTDSETDDRSLLGGKGAGLVTMTRKGLRVPPAFVLSTRCCAAYLTERALSGELIRDVGVRVRELEAATNRTFGSGPDPLLLSVRSGAPVSMPGMMDTVLNLGLNRSAAIALARRSGSSRFMADVLARFHSMYAEIVLDSLEVGESPVDDVLNTLGADADAGVIYDALWERLQAGLTDAGEPTVPADPFEQLVGAVEAVFRSWNTRRAITYRDHHGIDHSMGTAVVVQAMVFGNRDAQSGSGVVFSRNPVTGEHGLYGEYLSASQGEDVVAGTRTPDPVSALAITQPDIYDELARTVAELESSYRDVLDIEFTVESGILYFLQVRSAKRTAPAAVRIAADFLTDTGGDASNILSSITLDHLRGLMRPRFDESQLTTARDAGHLVARGIGASPGQVVGRLVLSPDRAEELARGGEPVILVRQVTSPTDLHGMIAAAGVVTATGGATSHAAVVARALGKACAVGCAELSFDDRHVTVRVGDRLLREGDWISLDGEAGEVYDCAIAISDEYAASAELDIVTGFCRDASDTEVLVRASSVAEIERVRHLGLPGVVVAAADVLATSPHFLTVAAEIRHGVAGKATFDSLADVLEESFTPLFAAAGEMEFGIRAIDFLVDETSELLRSDSVLIEQPALSLPLGSTDLIAAHVRGLARARAVVTGPAPRVHLSVRNISDVGEAAGLAALSSSEPEITVGAYVSSPRGAMATAELAERLDPVWVELRLLQAAMFGLPPRLLLTREPLDAYVSAGLLSVNPRHDIDPVVRPFLVRVADAAASDAGGGRVGLRVSGPVSENLLAELYGLGLRRYAVDFAEAAPALLALAKAALSG